VEEAVMGSPKALPTFDDVTISLSFVFFLGVVGLWVLSFEWVVGFY
jgi:hypothetical protein